jgi:hypothetical protein
MKKYSYLIIALFWSMNMHAQGTLHLPVNIQKAYENQSRDLSGQPGANYWQNKSEYKISVKLDPSNGNVSGMEKIIFHNNSPDSLNEMVISLLSDIYQKGNQNDFALPFQMLNDGVEVEKLTISGEKIDLNSSGVNRSGTNLIVQFPSSLPPASSTEVEVKWNFTYPKRLPIRCGDYGDSTFFVAYFYPKIAVYDDLDGWDKHNYTGFAEFYGDFNDYHMDITVPRKFKVWATGELMNANGVFTKEYYQKWLEAQESMEVYSMIAKDNYLDEDITRDNEWNTWQFKAENVTDFAFGTSDKFLWDVINVVVDPESGRKTTFNAAYRVDSKDYYKMAELGKKVLTDYSTRIPGIPYPFPEMTIFNGNSGMEFPMMCNNVSCEPWHETAGLAYHEVAHTYFPFYVGTNERKYAWMDEGWANLLPFFYFEEHSPDFDYFGSRVERYLGVAGQEIEVPSMTLGDILTVRPPYRQASYNKPFLAYFYLSELLGWDEFIHSFQHYIKSWAGKHPMPYDFFNSFNTASGRDLNWYWQNWFFDRNHADLSLKGMEGDEVIVENVGGLFLPVYIDIMYMDGHNTKIYSEIDSWKKNAKRLKFEVKNPKQIKSIRLGNAEIPDVEKANNYIEF